MVLRLAGTQMRVTRCVADNESRIARALDEAARLRADFLVTPEAAVSGMRVDFEPDEVTAAAERLRARASSARVGLLLGTYWEGGGRQRFNQVRVYTLAGRYLGAHSKVLRCSSLADPGTGEMSVVGETPLRTFAWKGITFGILICNDLWATPGYTTIANPYLPWQLQRLGARLIIHAVNSGGDLRYRAFAESSVDLWAYALGVPIFAVNALLDDETRANARSGLVAADGAREVVVPDTGEHLFCCDISL